MMITLNIPEEHVDIIRMVFMGVKANAVEARTALYPLINQINRQLDNKTPVITNQFHIDGCRYSGVVPVSHCPCECGK